MMDFDKGIQFSEKTNDVLSIGELLIDMISCEYGDDLGSGHFLRCFGGAPANIAMNVKKLGNTSRIAASVGKDPLGEYLIKHIIDIELDNDLIEQVPYSTSMVVLPKSKNTPIPIFYRSADYHLQFSIKIEEAIKSSKIIHFSCWPISKSPFRETIERTIQVAKRQECLVCFDPNYHPMIWESDDALDYIKRLISKIDIIKPSEVDAERIFGPDTHENQIAKFHACGAKLVIMTIGKDGAIVSNGLETRKYSSLATEIVDTTGAGDAFWAGFYCGLLNGYTVHKSIELGSGVSAYKLKQLGAIVELPKLDMIRKIYHLTK